MIDISILNSCCRILQKKLKFESIKLKKAQLMAVAESLREIGVNLFLAVVVSILFERNRHMINQVTGIFIALFIWYTGFKIYKSI